MVGEGSPGVAGARGESPPPIHDPATDHRRDIAFGGISTVWDAHWPERAQCRDLDPDAMFVSGAAQHEAKRVCRGCPVLTECLAEALDTATEFGVWGGMTERERRSLLLRRPTVTSWRQLFESSRDQLRTG